MSTRSHTPLHRTLVLAVASATLGWAGLTAAEEPRAGDRPPPAAAPPIVPPVPPPAVPVPDVTPPPRPGDVFDGKPREPDAGPAVEEHSWFDAGHAFVGRMFFAPTVRLDRFFSDQTDLDPERAQSFARLRTSLRLRQDGKPRYGLDFVADVKLPGLNRWLDDRFRLILTGQSETSEDALNPDGTTNAFTSRDRTTPNLELRFGAYKGIRNSVDLGAGVLFRLPPGAFGRVRYRLAVPIDDVLLARFSTQGFWRTDMHLGARASSELDWPFTPSSQLRLGAASQVAQRRTRGIEYGTELVLAHAFSPTVAVALGTDAQGSVRDPVLFYKYRVYGRVRHDVLRRWLFVELEPEIGWPWTRQRGRYRAFAVLFRVEVQFEGAGAVEATAPDRPPDG